MSILVTGASSGIGYAVSKSLVSLGCDVIAVARSQDLLESLKRECGEHIQIVIADLSKVSGCDKLVEYVGTSKQLKGLVHAAGSNISPTHYQQLDGQTILEDMNIHVMTPISLNNRLRDKLIGSRILYIDSYSAKSARTGWAGYSIVKAAAQMAALSAADEIKESRVIRVFPGAVRTPLVNAVLESSQISPTVDMFKKMDAAGEITDAETVGEFIANILLRATDSQLDEREYWDFNDPHDRMCCAL